MAIFTNKFDRETVPLLVQLAQIDIYDPEEVFHAAELIAPTDLESYYEDHLESDVIGETEEACGIVRWSLHLLATESAMPAECIVWMEEKRIKESPTWDIALKDDAEDDSVLMRDNNDVIRISDLVKIVQVDRSYHWDSISMIVATELEKIVQAVWAETRLESTLYKVCSLCPECGNPMLYQNSKRVYCSRRCADRVGQRRRRGHNKAVNKSRTVLTNDYATMVK